MERRVIVITGPTCSGKTFLSLKLAEKLKSEIVSADSRQIYKYLNIGTAKPAKDELAQTKHHFINYLNPDEDYNVSLYETEALEICNNLLKNDKIPIVVGGSGLYVKALVDGLFTEIGVDEDYREKLNGIRNKHGNDYLYEELKKVDPESASKMLPQNWKRVMRALEVYQISGKPISEFQENFKRENDIKFIQFGLNWKREVLYENIEKRVDEMMEKGLIEETKKVLMMGYNKNCNSLNTVGYKEMISFLDNEITLERAIELIKRNTRRYAKRQMTWFRKDERIKWFYINSNDDLGEAAVKIFGEIKSDL
ncbi:MAG: tRNA (adenosine(37)-N6)-dimethylallyltransferase MiaA [Ignavibacteria bacterium]